ncbi:MAG: hypothetical protein J7K51_07730 [Thermotogae bacterium]|nr:hypothetical protein [Thermotogota bacterium]
MFLGIDIGTTRVKEILVDESGNIVEKKSREIRLEFGDNGEVEVDPGRWIRTIIDLSRNFDLSRVEGIGLSGQMHTLVLIDRQGKPLRKAIIWADARGKKEEDFLRENFSKDILTRCGSVPSRSFTFVKLLYVLKNENIDKDNCKLCLSKDFIGGWLTKNFDTERTDASATLMYDITEDHWYTDLMEELKVPESILPDVHKSLEVRGYLGKDIAELLNMREGIPVVYGAGDQESAAFGVGVSDVDEVMLSLSTGGQIIVPVKKPIIDRSVHNFLHIHGFHIMGAIQNLGLVLNWANNVFGFKRFEDLTERALLSMPGANGVIFLPYITPERTPIMKSDVKGYLTDLRLCNTRSDIARAILEGVSFALVDAWKTVERLTKLSNPSVFVLGGVAKNPIIREIIFPFLSGNINLFNGEFDASCYGAALMAKGNLKILEDIKKYRNRFIIEKIRSFNNVTYAKPFERFLELRKKILNLKEENDHDK